MDMALILVSSNLMPDLIYTANPSSNASSRSSRSRPVHTAPYTLSGTATSKLSHAIFSAATSTSPPRSSRDISSSSGCGASDSFLQLLLR